MNWAPPGEYRFRLWGVGGLEALVDGLFSQRDRLNPGCAAEGLAEFTLGVVVSAGMEGEVCCETD